MAVKIESKAEMMALKGLVSELYDLISKLVESVDLLQKALIYGNLKPVDDVKPVIKLIHERQQSLTEELVKESRINPSVVPYVAVAAHTERVAEGVERIVSALQNKINNEILFSDKAMSELNFLFEKTRDIILNARDIVLARNTIIASYIKEAERGIVRAANEFSTKHEERLIEGLCMPKASSVYLEMLDAFKIIAWHVKEIARDLAG
jgi:Na+/phosphate symporter